LELQYLVIDLDLFSNGGMGEMKKRHWRIVYL
jgi:hypothetical protein